ncbi:MAG: cytochrome P450, partial [Endomicrobium sp.]|nr:cytochrome P450 [Endomicrobium sp.]
MKITLILKNLFTRKKTLLTKIISLAVAVCFIFNAAGVCAVYASQRSSVYEKIQKTKKSDVSDADLSRSYKSVKDSFKIDEKLKETYAQDDERETSEKYDNVVNELALQSGLSKEEVEKMLSEIEPDKLDEAIGILSDFFAAGGKIVNCATDALAKVLETSSKGLLALQTLIADIA